MKSNQLISTVESIYLDTSVLMKIIKEEEKSNFIRALIYGSSGIKFYSSFVAFGELVSKLGRREIQDKIGARGFIFYCRLLMKDIDYEKIIRIEITNDSFTFLEITEKLLSRYDKIGGADIWHILSVLELIRFSKSVCFISFDKELVKIAKLENINAIDGSKINPDLVYKELKFQNKWIADRV